MRGDADIAGMTGVQNSVARMPRATAALLCGVAFAAGAQQALANDRSAGGGRDYSIHVIAKIPSICALRGLSRVIKLYGHTDDGQDVHPYSGVGDFRIECNVPYALDVARVAHRRVKAWVEPLSAEGTVDFDVRLDVPGVEGPLSAHCTNEDLARSKGCAAIAGAEDMRQPKPRAKGRMTVVSQPRQELGDANEYAMPLPLSGAPSDGTHLTLSLSARY